MDRLLKSDLDRFFRVYESDVEEILERQVPAQAIGQLSRDLDEEFMLLKRALLNRLSEEFPR